MLLTKYAPSQYNGADYKGHVTYNLDSDDPAPPPSSTSTTTIPEYAKPYVETLLGKAQALTDVNATPYQTYAGDRIAEQSQQQKDIATNILAQTMPGQFVTGTNLASTAGLAAAGAGADYAKLATSAAEQAKYMTPYMQNVVDIQKQEAIRDAQKGMLAQDLAAGRQGTYGGSRQLLAQLERERNLGDQLAKIQATGSQSAYDRAQQAMQFGTEAGLKGAQAATQAGATLGQLGIGQQQTYGDFAKLQLAAAAQDQADRQRKLDLDYQDFIAQQQDPYKRIGFMSDILRGSANLAGTGGKTIYEAPPSMLSQITGPGLLGLGLYRELNK